MEIPDLKKMEIEPSEKASDRRNDDSIEAPTTEARMNGAVGTLNFFIM